MSIREQSYRELSARWWREAEQQRLPTRVLFELTYRCNFACVHCYNSEDQKSTPPKAELSTQQVFEVLEQSRAFGVFVVGFTGGEVFLRPDAMDIFWYAKKAGFQVLIYTNGYYIDASVAKALGELRPNKVDISIHGVHANTFQKITGVADGGSKVYRAVHLLREQNVDVGIKSNLFSENTREIKDIKAFAESVGASFRWSPSFFPRNDGSKTPLAYNVSAKTVASVEREMGAPEVLPPQKSTTQPKNFPAVKKPFSCGFGYSSFVITPFGEMKFCVEAAEPLFPILGSSVKACWDDLVAYVDEEVVEAARNRSCPHWPECNCCPVHSHLSTGDYGQCDPVRRKRLEEGRLS